ncbi:hypothetical protein BDB01DRAFT_808659 [Pilobolus umbonatus]|nr:hypothetical protein BDB01DRAFT_808659 [Pilobolus umbonatus]
MDNLPLEILEAIITLIDRPYYTECLRVNKQWYYLIIKLLYHTIDINSGRRWKMFVESLAQYTRSMEAANYVRSITIPNATEDVAVKDSDIITVLLSCQQVERLLVDSNINITDVILDPKIPVLKCLTHLTFGYNNYGSENAVFDCYYKFRSSLVRLALPSFTDVTIASTPEELLAYLSCFSHLRELSIYLETSHFDETPLLGRIVQQIPELTSVYYSSTSLYTTTHENTIENQHALQSMTLRLSDFTLKDSHYIKSMFNQLETIDMAFYSALTDELETIEAIMSIRTLKKIKLFIYETHNKDIIHAFWRRANLTSTNKKLRNDNFSSFQFGGLRTNSIRLDLEECPDIGVRKMSSYIGITMANIRLFELRYEDYIQESGHLWNKLEIQDGGSIHRISLKLINDYCPALTELNLDFSQLTDLNSQVEPNNQLNTLYLNQSRSLNQYGTSFEKIVLALVQAYPLLESLYIINPCFIASDNKGVVHMIDLPFTNLGSLSVSKSFCFSDVRIMVLKEKDDGKIYSWTCSSQDKVMSQSDIEDANLQLYHLSETPLFIFKSSSVENVTIRLY